jgi:hypothetical protein
MGNVAPPGASPQPGMVAPPGPPATSAASGMPPGMGVPNVSGMPPPLGPPPAAMGVQGVSGMAPPPGPPFAAMGMPPGPPPLAMGVPSGAPPVALTAAPTPVPSGQVPAGAMSPGNPLAQQVFRDMNPVPQEQLFATPMPVPFSAAPPGPFQAASPQQSIITNATYAGPSRSWTQPFEVTRLPEAYVDSQGLAQKAAPSQLPVVRAEVVQNGGSALQSGQMLETAPGLPMMGETRRLEPLVVQSSEVTTRCVCGNVFMPDAVFCRHCGRKRPQGLL